MYIKLENINIAEKMNKILKRKEIEGLFITRKLNEEWLEDINNNPQSESKHLKPKDKDLTMLELKEVFSKWTEEGLYEIDLNFGRTSESQMQKLAEFISHYANDIEYITDVDLFIERGQLSEEYISILNTLQLKEKAPEQLPLEETNCSLYKENGLFKTKSKLFHSQINSVNALKLVKQKIWQINN